MNIQGSRPLPLLLLFDWAKLLDIFLYLELINCNYIIILLLVLEKKLVKKYKSELWVKLVNIMICLVL